MDFGNRGGKAAIFAILVVIGIVLFVLCGPPGGGGDDQTTPTATSVKEIATTIGTPTATETPEMALAFGKVVDTDGKPIEGAQVFLTGPVADCFSAPPATGTPAATGSPTSTATATATPTPNPCLHASVTDAAGKYEISDLVPGEYDVHVLKEGYLEGSLIGRQDQGVAQAPLIEDETEIDVTLYREDETVPTPTLDGMTSSPQATPEPGTEGFIFGKGVEEHENCRVLMMHLIIFSCEEIASIEPVTQSGIGWTTFFRSGTTISTTRTDYINEPFWRVTFKEERADGLEEVFVQRRCGNVSAPPGEEVPQGKEVPPTPTTTPVVVPPATPPGSTPTPRPPTATQPPLFMLGCPQFLLHGDDDFTRVGTATASRDVSWLVTGDRSILHQHPRGITIWADEGATVQVVATDEFGRIRMCEVVVPISEQGATPVPTRLPAPTLPPPPDPTATPVSTPIPPP